MTQRNARLSALAIAAATLGDMSRDPAYLPSEDPGKVAQELRAIAQNLLDQHHAILTTHQKGHPANE